MISTPTAILGQLSLRLGLCVPRTRAQHTHTYTDTHTHTQRMCVSGNTQRDASGEGAPHTQAVKSRRHALRRKHTSARRTASSAMLIGRTATQATGRIQSRVMAVTSCDAC